MNWIKRAVFYVIALLPLLSILAFIVFFSFYTNFPQLFYSSAVRNIYFDCVEYVPFNTVYALAAGECELKNLEYKTIITSDANGYRNTGYQPPPDVAVIGDSHAQGFGVNDTQTFPYILNTTFNFSTVNLGMGSYDTVRELESLIKFGHEAEYVVIQYCDNDHNGNLYYINNGLESYINHVREAWKSVASSYFERKASGIRGLLKGFSESLKKSVLNADFYAVSGRDIKKEAEAFTSIISDYEQALKGKKLIILESSGWGRNHPLFKQAFSKAILARNITVDITVLDMASFLERSDYYSFDDHLNETGHAKLAETVAAELNRLKAL